MAAAYMHIGIPVTNKKPGMVYNEGARFWVSSVDDYDYKIEYLKFEEGTPFPEVLHRNPHVAYKVDDLQKYIDDADSVICGPMDANDKGDQLAFVWKDGAILALYLALNDPWPGLLARAVRRKAGSPASVGWGLNRSQRYLVFDNRVSLLLYP